MIETLDIGLDEALKLMFERISPLPPEEIGLFESVGRVVAHDVTALVDSPSVDASLKDGFAVISDDIESATPGNPVRLKLAGNAAAGVASDARVTPGTAVQVFTGAKIPDGADAVVAGEFAETDGDTVTVTNFAEPGRNIMLRGTDVAVGRTVVEKGQTLTPGICGILAASGHGRVSVFRGPTVGILATGDEVVAPGAPLPEGKLYASNLTTLGAWCRRYGWEARMDIVPDAAERLERSLTGLLAETDAILTSGGAWTGDRDLIARILAKLGWQKAFHRIRIGPGKAVGFGLLDDKPVFILPGGPPSNLMGFLQIALPGLLKLAGHRRTGLPRTAARLASHLTGRHAHWTQFIYGVLENTGCDLPRFRPLKGGSRLRSMAEAHGIVAIPEGETVIPAGTVITVQRID